MVDDNNFQAAQIDALLLQLNDALTYRTRFEESADPAEKRNHAFMSLVFAARALADILGKDLVQAVGGSTSDDRADRLRALQAGIIAVAPLLAQSSELEQELVAVLAGDNPRLLARLDPEGRRLGNAYRKALCEMKAVRWDSILEACGLTATERRRAIEDAYNHPWDTIRKWPGKAKANFGDEFVSDHLDFINGDTLVQLHPEMNLDAWLDQLRLNGEDYRKELYRLA